MCRAYLRKWQVSASEVTVEELLSEVWEKLLGTVSLDHEQTEELTALPPEWSINPDAPERDDRVVWLIREIGGSVAITHRLEDISRQRYGRFQPGRGRPIVQLGDEDEFAETGTDPEEPNTLHHVDVHRVWRGLLITAHSQFQKHDDVLMLLRVMDDVRDLLEEFVWSMADQKNSRFAQQALSIFLVD